MQAPTQDRELRKDDLPYAEQRVLEELTRSRTTTSAIILAADIWQRGTGNLGVDPVGFIGLVLEGLNEMGLVTYTEGKTTTGGNHEIYAGFPSHIRLSQAGWALMGYPNRVLEVGRMAARREHTHGPDKTVYRNHGDTAIGGLIEVDTFAEHKVLYPHHVHMYGGEEENSVMTRGYVKVTPDLEMHVLGLRARHPAASNEEIAEQAEVPIRTVKYILTELPRLRRLKNGEDQSSASLKQRIIWALQEGEFPDVKALRLVLGRADTDHDIVHVLHSLHKEGMIDFTEVGSSKQPNRIHMRQRGNKPRLMAVPSPETVDAYVATQPEEEPVVAAAQDASTTAQLNPGDAEYPILVDLLQREVARQAKDRKALQYIEAAELLKETDPETAALLMSKAQENNAEYPNPVELEYMRYANDHEV